ncbi:MAG: flagellar FliJ family protein [Lachnospiraceae bacterium]
MARKVQELAREKLQNAMQERKTQEKLYENAFEDFKKEVNAKESKEVDELTSYTYGKNRRQESGE